MRAGCLLCCLGSRLPSDKAACSALQHVSHCADRAWHEPALGCTAQVKGAHAYKGMGQP